MCQKLNKIHQIKYNYIHYINVKETKQIHINALYCLILNNYLINLYHCQNLNKIHHIALIKKLMSK